MLASCDNCAFRSQGICSLTRTPDAGNVLCNRYQMTDTFRERILDLLRRDVEKQVNAVLLRFRVEQVDAIAG